MTGTFKARGALTWALSLTPEQKARGITAVSAGNHAIAAAFAAKAVGAPAKIVGAENRQSAAPRHGARSGRGHPDGGERAGRLRHRRPAGEGRGPHLHPPVRRTATWRAAPARWARRSRMTCPTSMRSWSRSAAAASPPAWRARSSCCSRIARSMAWSRSGAPSMRRSFDQGAPVKLDRIDTIADSLAPPMSLPYSFGLARAHMDDIVLVDDDAMCAGAGAAAGRGQAGGRAGRSRGDRGRRWARCASASPASGCAWSSAAPISTPRPMAACWSADGAT